MTVALLDTNDCVLQLWGAGPVQQSPGYALLEGKDYQFGNCLLYTSPSPRD